MLQDYYLPSVKYSPSSVEAGSQQPAKKLKGEKKNKKRRKPHTFHNQNYINTSFSSLVPVASASNTLILEQYLSSRDLYRRLCCNFKINIVRKVQQGKHGFELLLMCYLPRVVCLFQNPLLNFLHN